MSSAFDPENFGPVMIIQMMRLYDIGLALLAAVDPEQAEKLADLHENGITFCPPPRLANDPADSA